MKLYIPKDMFDNYYTPRLFLCTTSGKRIQELCYYDGNLNAKWSSYSELGFSIDRTYVDLITGETKVHPAFDKAESLRQVLVENIGYFILQDTDDVYSDKDSKSLSAFSAEYSCGQKYLENFKVNTGEVDSKEVIYELDQYGSNATKDQMYKLASYDSYDSHEQYYHRVYTDSDSYTYERIQVVDEANYKLHFGEDIHPEEILYIHGYANVKFYDPNTPELSLLHLVFEKIPEWKIKDVDYVLRNKERKFEEDRIDVYSFLTQNIVDTFNCVVYWDTLEKTVSFYDEANDGLTEDDSVATRWDTDVYISKDNLASEINIRVSGDNIKTQLKVSGGDDLSISEVNLGKNYILNLDYYHNEDWMEQDLIEAYDAYLKALEDYSPLYEDSVQGWLTAQNQYYNMMHNIAVETNIVLKGDIFKKLYCLYEPFDTAYIDTTIDGTYQDGVTTVENLYSQTVFTDVNLIDKTDLKDNQTFTVQGYRFVYNKDSNNFTFKGSMMSYNMTALLKKLWLYHVDDDTTGKNSDNILLKLNHSNSNTATIRIYDPHKVADSYQPGLYYYVKNDNETFTDVSITDTEAFEKYDELYTNDYKIQCVVVDARNGIAQEPIRRDLSAWINGALTDEDLGVKDYTISFIGTMGAYLVLAKDEKEPTVIEEYGINQLQEKYDKYLEIFLDQTQNMLSHEDNQCIASNELPTGNYIAGTRWLDTNSRPAILMEYNGTEWKDINASDDERKNYEDYARYIDNYEKMVATQEMLVKKKRDAEYWLSGYMIPDRVINLADGSSLTENMQTIAEQHFSGHTVTGELTDVSLPLYTFTTSFDPKHEFAVYLIGTTPYVAYKESMGVYQAQRENISKKTDLEAFFDDEQLARLSPLIREDVFEDQNFLFAGYESAEEEVKILKELMDAASKELKTLSQPSLEFSMTMANILALPEFESIVTRFALGNFIRIELRPGIVKRSRLLECNINFNDFSDFSCTFGNLITTKSEIDLHAELLRQAVSAGKQVAASKGSWQSAVDKSNKLEQDIANGLQDIALKIKNASGQSVEIGKGGLIGRKLVDGTTDQYEDEQVALINNKLVFTADNWKTSKSAFGKYVVDGEERWGTVAEYITSEIIEGKMIKGGKIQIGDENKEGGNLFIVYEDGSVEIISNGVEKYASKSAMEVIDDAYRYRVELSYNNSTVFANTNDNCTITCTIYDNRLQKDVTSDFITKGATFSWIRASSSDDTTWNNNHKNQATNTITITRTDIEKNAQFSCEITIDETKMPSDDTQQS